MRKGVLPWPLLAISCRKREQAGTTAFDAVDGSPQWHRNVSIRNIYGPTASYILAFSERQLMAINGH